MSLDLNNCIFTGKVEDKPTIQEVQGKKYASFNLVVNDRVPTASGQWVDQPVTIPIYATDKRAEVVANNVVAGHMVTVLCSYRAWKDQAGNAKHTFQINSILLGYKPRSSEPESAMGDMPPM